MSIDPRLIKMTKELLQRPVRSVTIALGELFPLSEEQLRAQWNELVMGTTLSQTKLSIHLIRAQQQCMTCFEKYRPMNMETSCPHCGGVGAKILAGEELYLETRKLEDE